jgi:hypothetical protein
MRGEEVGSVVHLPIARLRAPIAVQAERGKASSSFP